MGLAVFRLIFHFNLKNNEKTRRVLYYSILLSKFANSNIYRKDETIKILMVALTLLMGISFTSCLNSDNDYAPTVGGFVKVGGGMFGTTFTMLDGATTISPTAASLTQAESNMGFKYSKH